MQINCTLDAIQRGVGESPEIISFLLPGLLPVLF